MNTLPCKRKHQGGKKRGGETKQKGNGILQKILNAIGLSLLGPATFTGDLGGISLNCRQKEPCKAQGSREFDYRKARPCCVSQKGCTPLPSPPRSLSCPLPACRKHPQPSLMRRTHSAFSQQPCWWLFLPCKNHGTAAGRGKQNHDFEREILSVTVLGGVSYFFRLLSQTLRPAQQGFKLCLLPQKVNASCGARRGEELKVVQSFPNVLKSSSWALSPLLCFSLQRHLYAFWPPLNMNLVRRGRPHTYWYPHIFNTYQSFSFFTHWRHCIASPAGNLHM